MLEDVNATRVDDAVNQYVRAQTQARVEALQLKGKNALERPDGRSLPDEYGEKLRDLSSSIAGSLGNDAQRQRFGATAARLDNQFQAALSEHMVAQQVTYRRETRQATVETAISQGALLWGDQKALQQSTAVIAAAVQAEAQDSGWDDATKSAAFQKAISPMHAAVMQSMITSGRADAAKAYYNANSEQMTVQVRASMQGVIQTANDNQMGEAAAEAAWTAGGPQAPNDAVKLFDLERQARAALKDNPAAATRAVAALRERAQAFNQQQAELNNSAVNAVYDLIDDGASMSQLQRSAPWLALPGAKRAEILAEQDRRRNTQASTELQVAQREVALMQVRDKKALLDNGDRYLALMFDPAMLRDMKPEAVRALRPTFGMEGVQHLLAKRESLQRPGAIDEAKIDNDTFNELASQMKLNPDAKKGTADHKQLGQLRFRVEQLINTAQQKKGQVLTGLEKSALMREEMARTVKVEGWFGSSDVPVIRLQPGDVEKIKLPADQRAALAAEMARLYAVGQNPAYAPTDMNLRRYYLRKQSAAAPLVNTP
jgi:hypothetical protein